MSEIRQVQIRFTVADEKHGSYSDALYFPLEEFEKITQEDIDAEKQERLANWVEAIENPIINKSVEKTKEELEDEKRQLVSSLEILQEQVAFVEAKIIEVKSKTESDIIEVESKVELDAKVK